MKKWIFATLLLCGFCLVLPQFIQAQDRIRALRVAFITDKLNLTPEESEKFWPVYNQYEAEQKRIRQKYRSDLDLNTLSDQEVERAVLDRFTMEEELIKVKRDFFLKMKGFMAVRKIALLQRSEQEFNKELLRRIQEAKGRK
jgi:hypothetical protein